MDASNFLNFLLEQLDHVNAETYVFIGITSFLGLIWSMTTFCSSDNREVSNTVELESLKFKIGEISYSIVRLNKCVESIYKTIDNIEHTFKKEDTNLRQRIEQIEDACFETDE
jgi:peptidoglycan hydrolase CwlO-like protein